MFIYFISFPTVFPLGFKSGIFAEGGKELALMVYQI